jgi:type IX secretion system PorP/SprF family membrane protein
MKKLFTSTLVLTLLLLLGGVGKALAQQLPQLSQYTLNMQMYNPAVSGIEDFVAGRAGFRQQNQGISDAPSTLYVNVHGALNQRELNKEDLGALPMRGASSIRFKTETIRKIRHGLGGNFMSDRAGQFARNSFSASYAIHIPFANKWYFSGGASLGASFLQLNTDWKNLRDNAGADNALAGRTRGLLDLQLGAMVYTDKFYLGLSTAQLAQNKLKFGDNAVNLDEAKLNVHYYLTTGYRLVLSDELDLLPTALVKFSKVTYAADLQTRVRFRQGFYAGMGYRIANANVELTGDAVTGLVGLSFNKTIDVAYSYDFTTSKLSTGSNGSHEIVLGVRLNNTKKVNPRIW